MDELDANFAQAEVNLERALDLAGDCQMAYREAAPHMRRQFNLAFFTSLFIDEDYTVTGDLAEPFDVLLGDPLRRAAIAKADAELRAAVEEALRRRPDQESQNERRPPVVLVGTNSPTTSSEAVGWSQVSMVELEGLEPSTSAMPWRRSSS